MISATVDVGNVIRNLVILLVGRQTGVVKQLQRILRTRLWDRFTFQGSREKPWPERHVPSKLGILADLALGPTVSPRRFQRRPALVVTETLRKSVRVDVTGPLEFTIRSGVSYAAKHEDGGVETVLVTPTVRANYAVAAAADVRVARALQAVLRRGSHTAMVEQRSFLAPTASDVGLAIVVLQSALARP